MRVFDCHAIRCICRRERNHAYCFVTEESTRGGRWGRRKRRERLKGAEEQKEEEEVLKKRVLGF